MAPVRRLNFLQPKTNDLSRPSIQTLLEEKKGY